MSTYKFKAKELKTGNEVHGDLIYAQRAFESSGVKPMIVKTYIHGGIVWIGSRHFVDENTIELYENKNHTSQLY